MVKYNLMECSLIALCLFRITHNNSRDKSIPHELMGYNDHQQIDCRCDTHYSFELQIV